MARSFSQHRPLALPRAGARTLLAPACVPKTDDIWESMAGTGIVETGTGVVEARAVAASAPLETGKTMPGPHRKRRSGLRTGLAVIWIAVAASATVAGYGYYTMPWAARPFAASHALYSPTGLVGHSLGIAGATMMAIGVGMYMARKRLTFLSGWGRLGAWLDVHIFLCTLGPFLVLLHTSFRIGGLVAIAFWSMVAVVASGIFGRYLYGHIPKTIHGHFRSLAAMEQSRAGMERALRRAGVRFPSGTGGTSTDVSPGLFTAMVDAIRFDLTRVMRKRAVRERLNRIGVPAGARERLATLLLNEERIRQQIFLLRPFHRLFRYWHVLHLPLAIVMLLILAVHVGVAIAFGYGWPSP
jgi:hypothetical protein